MNKNLRKIKDLLDQKYDEYNRRSFIENDPISVPHRFTRKEDIEISGFLTATISWGKRELIINQANVLMQMMDFEPYNFIMFAGKHEMNQLSRFYYRTFKFDDLLFFIYALRSLYISYHGLEGAAIRGFERTETILGSITYLREKLLETPHLKRSEKHLANPNTGSSAKRINMFLRWMVRNDNRGVDFGLWKNIRSDALKCPLDLHSGKVARNLGLLSRKQNDWQAVEELTENLGILDPQDPVKYDFALFGMGVFEKHY